MAQHAFQQLDFSLIKKKVSLFAVIDFGNSGAPTLKQWAPTTGGVAGAYSAANTPASGSGYSGTQGIAGIVQNTTGDYTVYFQQSYQRLLRVEWSWQNASGKLPPQAPWVFTVMSGGSYSGTSVTASNSPGNTVSGGSPSPVIATGGYVEVQTSSNATTPVPSNPASGERLVIEFVLDDSGAI